MTSDQGVYVGYNGSGVIKCTSSSQCTFIKASNTVNYINNGIDKQKYGIINCSKRKGCSVNKAKNGYYITYLNTLLIHCSGISCNEILPTAGYYESGDSSSLTNDNTIINCNKNGSVVTCALEKSSSGFYLTPNSNSLILCKNNGKCNSVLVKNGFFRSAIKSTKYSYPRSSIINRYINDNNNNDYTNNYLNTSNTIPLEYSTNKNIYVNQLNISRSIDEEYIDKDPMSISLKSRESENGYSIIRCISGKCMELTLEEVASIPVCEFDNNKCYITNEYAMIKGATTSISAGDICTDAERSVFYFATDTVIVKPNVIAGVMATYVHTTTNSNCLLASASFKSMYFTGGTNIYRIDNDSIIQILDPGYYFINIAKRKLISGYKDEDYNDENVKLFSCNNKSCRIHDKSTTVSYVADVNKHILRYDPYNNKYSLAYETDVICIYDDHHHQCIPNANIGRRQFCITYKGELVLAKTEIKSRESGECYKADTINTRIYAYSEQQQQSQLFSMNLYSAQKIDEDGYYIVNTSTNTPPPIIQKNSNKNNKNKNKNNNYTLYGCFKFSCKIYMPEKATYYYDKNTKNLYHFNNGRWNIPEASSGFALISLDPNHTFIQKFTTTTLNEIEIKKDTIKDGYYYTVDKEMYHCHENDGDNGNLTCKKIENSGYYYTRSGEVYYCIYDSEELEDTECTKKMCIHGQYYYFNNGYYYCQTHSVLVPVSSRYCSYNDHVIIHFPPGLINEFPGAIKKEITSVEVINRSSSLTTKQKNNNYLKSYYGVFTNCTYDADEATSTFDLICMNNYVRLEQKVNNVQICSVENLGFVECEEDKQNPEKCYISSGITNTRFIYYSSLLYQTIIILIITYISIQVF